jgi:cytochrome c oxidase subunit 4
MATHDHHASDAPLDPHDDAHEGAGVEHEHPTWKQYKWVALWLTVITIGEVWAYYIPTLVASRAFRPAMLIMSAVKFIVVVMFYMHLKYDHKLFRALFVGPLLIAMSTIAALLFLFGHLAMRLRVGS